MSLYHSRMQTRTWKITRSLVFQRDSYLCQDCKRPGKLECDHVIPLRNYPGNPFDMSNLQSLCTRCHLKKTRREARRPVDQARPQQAAWNRLIAAL